MATKYGLVWQDGLPDLAIEMQCIQFGGRWKSKGKEYGMGIPYHYEQMRRLIWPHLDCHRWHELCLSEIIKNKITVLMGPGSSGKTHEAAGMALMEYFCFPEETCVLVSSTDLRGLELRVWGEIKMLHGKAIERFPWLPGHLIDSKHAIATDEVEEDRARDLRKGIIGIPCVQNGKFVGLGKYAGIKQKRMRLVADEAQFMGGSFLSAFANLDKNADFKAVVLGNPNDPLDPLGKAAEPLDGWTAYMDVKKTTVWKTRFMGGACVNLIGTDSPNFDDPDKPNRYPYLIGPRKIANTLSFFPAESIEFMSQCVGNMKVATLEKRVISREFCAKHKAFEVATWDGGSNTIKIGALDAAYGGDRCVGGHIEFGKDVSGKHILKIYRPVIVPMRLGGCATPEDSIAKWIREYCETHSVRPENFYHDSTGRGSLGTALARAWSAECNPVEFGGPPTERPVCKDMYVYDPKTKGRRLKTCAEHYKKFVTELWFSVAYAIEAEQIRELPEDVMEEGCMRQWELVGDKKEIETKEEMKERVGRSPDLFDWLAIAVEGARRRGFEIDRLANEAGIKRSADWLAKLRDGQRKLLRSRELKYSED